MSKPVWEVRQNDSLGDHSRSLYGTRCNESEQWLRLLQCLTSLYVLHRRQPVMQEWINIKLRVNDDVIIIFRWTTPLKTATQLETCIIWPAIGEVSVYYPLLKRSSLKRWCHLFWKSTTYRYRACEHDQHTRTEAVSKNIVCCLPRRYF